LGSGACSQTNPATGYFTYYAYDPLNNLISVNQGSQSRSYNYDGLGRLTSETNPKTGQTQYTHDTDSACGAYAGDLVKRYDAVQNVTCYAYDYIHRLTQASYPSGAYAGITPTKNYVYEGATVNGNPMSNTAGRLAEAYTGGSGSKITDLGFGYSPRGDVTTLLESTPHLGGYYGVNATYWPNGLLNTLNGVGLPTMTYTPDPEGRISQVSASAGGQNPVLSPDFEAGNTGWSQGAG
jgi:YD repeat-containing protein